MSLAGHMKAGSVGSEKSDGLYFDACFSQLEPKPPSGGQTKIRRHFAPDDEGAFEYENYHSPDHTH
jgi:hypothetical protein